MTVNIKDNIEYAAAMLWFLEHPVFKEMEDKSAYIHTILEFFRGSVATLLMEIQAKTQSEIPKLPVSDIIEDEDVSYLTLCALGQFIVNEDYKPTDDDYKYYEKIEATFQTPASKMKRPNVENCIPEFTRLHTHWLDWFIHRNPPEASEKYGIIAPSQLTANQKAKWYSWVQSAWKTKDSPEAGIANGIFYSFIYGDMTPSLKAAVRGALQKQQQSLALMRKNAPADLKYE